VKHPDARLLILSKAPDPGSVKTRLIPLLGAMGAARLYATMLHTGIDRLVAAGLCPVDLWCAPTTDHPFFIDCRQRYGVALQQQAEGDLGQRMAHALGVALRQSRYAVLVGADCPGLAVEDIEEGLQALEQGVDVVLGPALDGGYYLVAMRHRQAFLFDDMPWGSADILQLTESRLRARNVSWHKLALRRDLDTPKDYEDYMALQQAD
jgi:rSAM/selenodomain-associated transferase 1